MDTKSGGTVVAAPSEGGGIAAAAAAVTGARHLRTGRNGQDAAVAWLDGDRGAIVVCDGCSAGAHSELGARLGSQLVIARLAQRLRDGARIGDGAVWTEMRGDVAAELARLVERMAGDPERALHDHFLFTIVAAAWHGDEVAVWALGDGAYALGARVHVLGPFDDNRPPYLAYDLLGTRHEAHFAVQDASCGSVLVATDGIAELGFDSFVNERDVARLLAHPDTLRRRLAVRARASERVDWDARRIERHPAPLQDDGAIAILRWAR